MLIYKYPNQQNLTSNLHPLIHIINTLNQKLQPLLYIKTTNSINHFLLRSSLDSLDQPFHAFLKSFPRVGRTSHNRPRSIMNQMKSHSISNFISRNSRDQILFIGKNECRNSSKFVILKKRLKLSAGLFQTISVG